MKKFNKGDIVRFSNPNLRKVEVLSSASSLMFKGIILQENSTRLFGMNTINYFNTAYAKKAYYQGKWKYV